ncbi:type II secretion system protein [Undibacterium sp.]|jgi:general secretion pathway protein G|uniref:type II secretion system protein n=1 Tax=Undibacterium sp. TaxID=1914977 RepID=UPI002B791C56|nr:type II secretion system protein [Undibacterium sp.]HTD05252.1 type II secretion system protein [Undibacterium sp.]
MSYPRRRIAGFSLIELMASAAILGLLATVAVPFVETTVKRQKEHELRLALNNIRQAIDAYKLASAGGHIATKPEQSGYPPSLTELVGGVTDLARPGGPKLYFLRSIPRDPFFADGSVAAIDTWGKRSYDSPPDHPREGDDVFDVYSTSAQTGLNGVPYQEW